MDSRYVVIRDSFGSDGLGVPSVSIYFSYCDKGLLTGEFCKNCQNKDLQKDGMGILLTNEDIYSIAMKKLENIKSLTGKCNIVFLGGEPTANINLNSLKYLSKKFKEKDIETIMYTWKEKDSLNLDTLKYIDKTICGEYKEELKVDDYVFATSNQYVINNQKEIILKYERGYIQR